MTTSKSLFGPADFRRGGAFWTVALSFLLLSTGFFFFVRAFVPATHLAVLVPLLGTGWASLAYFCYKAVKG
jgi:hypothetical protein